MRSRSSPSPARAAHDEACRRSQAPQGGAASVPTSRPAPKREGCRSCDKRRGAAAGADSCWLGRRRVPRCCGDGAEVVASPRAIFKPAAGPGRAGAPAAEPAAADAL